ncbi:MAG: HAD-IC family P-type ATPase, partial [Christensenellales bacterium]
MLPIMITGDHLETAKAIAKDIGIMTDEDLAITGAMLDEMDDKTFDEKLERIRVYARVSPENKVRIVKAWKKRGKITAMTGDGVNDAPSIRSADIGIGMGITGTDVSKGVADIVLADDNFATIIVAVEEGRKVYSNIRKTVQYLLSANIAEVLTLFIATVFIGREFLTPVMILWINMITDSLPALALGMEKAEPNIMDRKPMKSGQSLFSGRVGIDIGIHGLMQTVLVLGVFLLGDSLYSHHETAMTMAFMSLGFIQLFHAYNTRSAQDSLLREGLFSNKYMNLAFLVSGLLQVSVVLLPFMHVAFDTVSLNPVQWAIAIGGALLIIPLVEVYKLIIRANGKRKQI